MVQGVFGFSQGATVAAILAAIVSHDYLHVI
jgi:hypothetical protein